MQKRRSEKYGRTTFVQGQNFFFFISSFNFLLCTIFYSQNSTVVVVAKFLLNMPYEITNFFSLLTNYWSFFFFKAFNVRTKINCICADRVQALHKHRMIFNCAYDIWLREAKRRRRKKSILFPTVLLSACSFFCVCVQNWIFTLCSYEINLKSNKKKKTEHKEMCIFGFCVHFYQIFFCSIFFFSSLDRLFRVSWCVLCVCLLVFFSGSFSTSFCLTFILILVALKVNRHNEWCLCTAYSATGVTHIAQLISKVNTCIHVQSTHMNHGQCEET